MPLRLNYPTKLITLLNPPRWVKAQFFISYICTVFTTLILLAVFTRIQPEVPLYYSLARPAQQLAPKEWLLLIPAISAFMSVTHLVIVNIFSDYDPMIIRLFSWTTVILQLTLSLALLRILIITA